MSQPKHTPGPWHIGDGGVADDYRVFDATDVLVADPDIFWTRKNRPGEHIGNAQLIAASPDLLAVLEEILNSTNLRGSGHPLEAKALAAIAKAKGDRS